MRALVLIIAAAGTILATAQDASAQWVRPRGISPAGDPICPGNYVYDPRGWCKPLYSDRGGPYERDPGYRGNPYYREPAYREYGPRRFGGYAGGGGVPPQWNSLGSAVCPNGYDYYIQYNRCLPR